MSSKKHRTGQTFSIVTKEVYKTQRKSNIFEGAHLNAQSLFFHHSEFDMNRKHLNDTIMKCQVTFQYLLMVQ